MHIKRKKTESLINLEDFHVILCLLRTIYSRFKDSGIIEILIEAGVGTEGMILSAIREGDAKQGIHYYKILFKPFPRSKINFLENSTYEESYESENKICNLCNNINHDKGNNKHELRFFLFLKQIFKGGSKIPATSKMELFLTRFSKMFYKQLKCKCCKIPRSTSAR